RHVGWLPERRPRLPPRGRDRLRPHPPLPARQPRRRPGPPRRTARAGQADDDRRPLGQGRALVAAEGAREAIRPPARRARRSPAREQAPLPRLPAQTGAAAALPPPRPRARRRPPQSLARL